MLTPLFTTETRQLTFDVAKGNRGALSVVIELCWFSRWYEMMAWCRDTGLVGEKFWIKYADDHKHQWYAFGRWIQDQMDKRDDYEYQTGH